MNPSRPSAPTRWILLGTIGAIVLTILGAVWLEAVHPQLDTDGNRVEGVPPLATTDVPSCRRTVDSEPISRIRETFPRGGRVGSVQIYACPAAYDGLTVSYVGEVVGELLPRDGGAWAQVNDDDYALVTGPVVGHREHAGFNTGLSVWLDAPLVEDITAPGRPALRGDVVLLRGTILRADPDDGGGITLRATELETLAPPLEIDPPLHVLQVVVAGVLSVLALAATLWAGRVRRR
ncbi:MAG: hypothetical protein R6V28_10250 [Nitriliruptoraceae bacterium]